MSLIALPLFGGGGALIPVGMLVEQSDAVVVAKITGGTVSGGVAVLELDIQKVLKGELHAGDLLSVDYQLHAEAVRYTRSVEKERGVFFLRNAGTKWVLQPVASGAVPDVRRAFFVLREGSTPKSFGNGVEPSVRERVLAEVAGAIESGDGPTGGGAIDFEGEYRSNPSPAIKALFAGFNTSTSLRLRWIGLRVAIASGDYAVLTLLEEDVEHYSETAIWQIAQDLRYDFNTTDPRSVAHLGRLAVAEALPAVLRSACLAALARLHTRESLPYLAQFLNDSDPDLQASAIDGIAMFVNNVPIGRYEPAAGPWKYRTEETLRYYAMDPTILQDDPRFAAFWISWWAEHRAEFE